MFMAAVMVWCASGLSEPSDMALAMKRLHGGSVSTCSRASGAGGADLEEVAQDGGFFLDGLSGEGSPGDGGLGRRQPHRAQFPHNLQSLDGLRLPGVRLGMVVLAEADPAIVGKVFGFVGVTVARAAVGDSC